MLNMSVYICAKANLEYAKKEGLKILTKSRKL